MIALYNSLEQFFKFIHITASISNHVLKSLKILLQLGKADTVLMRFKNTRMISLDWVIRNK